MVDVVTSTVDDLYRRHFGRLVAAVMSSLRSIDVETAEDVVHDAFSEAVARWGRDGIPINASGWLYTVCRHKALNLLRRSNRVIEVPLELITGEEGASTYPTVSGDDTLRMLILCAHPALAPKAQVALTLKYVVNLKVDTIAQLLGMSLDGIDKMLVRSRQRIREENISFHEPAHESIRQRLPTIHKVIYLLFNEGYKSVSGKTVLRKELCEEALILNKLLIDSGLADLNTHALHALMLFNAARFEARFNHAGELVELEHQDRDLWNRYFIDLANTFLERARTDAPSSYHLEASIVFVHAKARDFSSTDWTLITKLYQRLLALQPNMFVEFNLAIARYHAGDRAEALCTLERLAQHPYMSGYFLLHAALGKYYALEGDSVLAIKHLSKALTLTGNELEQRLVQRKIESILGQ